MRKAIENNDDSDKEAQDEGFLVGHLIIIKLCFFEDFFKKTLYDLGTLYDL